MKVKDVMAVDVHACQPDANPAWVAQIMGEHNRGIVPVVDADNRVRGVLANRDVCIAQGAACARGRCQRCLCGLPSLDDIILHVTENPKSGKLRDAVVDTLTAMCEAEGSTPGGVGLRSEVTVKSLGGP